MNKQPSSQGNLRMLLRSYTSAAKVFCFPEKKQKVKALVAQLCPTLCSLMDCSPPGASVPGDSPGQNTGVGGHFLLQGIIPTQGSNPGPSVLCLLVLWLWEKAGDHLLRVSAPSWSCHHPRSPSPPVFCTFH